ncbi:hypothetical protein D3C84_956500 [compost metagenome]
MLTAEARDAQVLEAGCAERVCGVLEQPMGDHVLLSLEACPMGLLGTGKSNVAVGCGHGDLLGAPIITLRISSGYSRQCVYYG